MPEDLSRYLLGVHDLKVKVSIGPDGAFPHQRRSRVLHKANLKAMLDCPNNCHGGGFELAHGLHDQFVARRLDRGRATLRCRGYENLGRGRRKACDHTCDVEAIITYGAKQF